MIFPWVLTHVGFHDNEVTDVVAKKAAANLPAQTFQFC